jgi:ammonium transporter, Amt family
MRYRRTYSYWLPVLLLLVLVCGVSSRSYAQAAAQPASAPAAAAAAPAAVAPVMDAPLNLDSAKIPSADTMAAGDPSGENTGNARDVTASNPDKGLTLADLVNQVGQNKIAINFVWTLITGFLVMFMQAGFAMVETGLCRAKNTSHTMMMNFMVYGFGMVAYWVCGFAIQMGGVGGIANLGGTAPLTSEFSIHALGQTWGLFGTTGFFLSGSSYDVGIMVIFLFQMVFMDTALTIVTGSAAERWKFSAFMIQSFLMGAILYPLFANWAWGGGWLSQLGANFGLGHGYVDFAGSGVVHAVGGITALATAIIVGPRIGKYNRDGSPNALPGHDLMIVLVGCFILAFGWFGFNPGSTLGASGNGGLRIGSVAVNTMLAGALGSFGAMFYMWGRYGKPDLSMTGNGLLAGLVAITAPSGFVSPMGSVIIGLIAGVLVCLSVEYFDRTAKVDDPVGAISVHGINGIWGVIATGLFADGRSNYGGGWNGVNGGVRGLFYGDASQLVAQLVGVAVLVGVVFGLAYAMAYLVEGIVGQRVTAEVELEGLDIQEIGSLAYPEFVLRPSQPHLGGGAPVLQSLNTATSSD